MTEEEAKQKWCPMILLTSATQAATIASLVGVHSSDKLEAIRGLDKSCIGTKCMLWRSTDKELKFDGNPCNSDDFEEAGYCGLAGKP